MNIKNIIFTLLLIHHIYSKYISILSSKIFQSSAQAYSYVPFFLLGQVLERSEVHAKPTVWCAGLQAIQLCAKNGLN